MSRIGILPIEIPKGVEISVNKQNLVNVKGPLGELSQTMDPCIKLLVNGNTLELQRENEENSTRSKHGLYRSLLFNMVKGVSEGFKIVQEVIGVGYKVQASGQLLELILGFSHSIFFELPAEVKVETVTEKGKSPVIILKSHDKQLIGQVAAKIRSFRKPEPYKGKGIRFQNEVVRRKEGKTSAS
jgi:large subunit ribosomal protein L6